MAKPSINPQTAVCRNDDQSNYLHFPESSLALLAECVFWYAACIRTHQWTFPRFYRLLFKKLLCVFPSWRNKKGKKVSLVKVAQGIKGAVNWLETTEMQGWRVITTFVSADAPSLLCHTLAARAAGYNPGTHYDETSGAHVPIQEPQSHSLSKTQVFLCVIGCADTAAVRFYH